MLKNILKLKGVQELNKTEQKSIKGSACFAICLFNCIRGGGGKACTRRCCRP